MAYWEPHWSDFRKDVEPSSEFLDRISKDREQRLGLAQTAIEKMDFETYEAVVAEIFGGLRRHPDGSFYKV